MPFIVSTQKGGSSNSQSYTTITDGSANAVLDNGNADDNSVSSSGLLVQNQNRTFNEQENGWDRVTSNDILVVLSSASRTSTTSSSDLTNSNNRGIGICLQITANGSSVGLTPELYAKTTTGNTYCKIWNAGTFSSATTKFFFIYPGISETEVGSTEQQNSMILPSTYRITIGHSAGDAVTYSVDAWRLK